MGTMTPVSRLCVLAALSALAAAPASASAAASWQLRSTPLPPSASDSVRSVIGRTIVVAAGARGGFVAWSRGEFPSTTGSSVARYGDDGTIGAEQHLAEAIEALALHRDGTATAVMTGDWTSDGSADSGGRRLPGASWQDLAVDGTPTQRGQLTSQPLLKPPKLAVNASGAAAAAWLEETKNGARLRVSVRRAGASFGRPQTLGRPDPADPQVGEVAVAISESGRVLVAFGASVDGPKRGNQALTWPRQQTLAWIGSTRVPLRGPVGIGRASENGGVRAAFDGRGRGFVAWGGPNRRSAVRVASLAPRAGAFSPPATLTTRQGWTPALATDPLSGGATVVWSGASGRSTATTINAAGWVSRSQALPAGESPLAAAALDGRAAVLSSRGLETSGALLNTTVSTRARNRSFGIYEQVVWPAAVTDIKAFSLGFNPSGAARLVTVGIDASGASQLMIATRLAQ